MDYYNNLRPHTYITLYDLMDKVSPVSEVYLNNKLVVEILDIMDNKELYQNLVHIDAIECVHLDEENYNHDVYYVSDNWIPQN